MFMVREGIERIKKERNKGFIAFLEKAYDRVNQYTLLRKLEGKGLNEQVVLIIMGIML